MTGPAHASARARALVLADDPRSRDLLTLSLRLAGYDVATARTAVEARRAAWSNSLDLLVVDPGLPGLDGAAPGGVLCLVGREVPVVLAAEPLRLETVLGRARLHLTAW